MTFYEPSSRRNSSGNGLILGIIFILIGYYVTFHLGKQVVNIAENSVDWPTVQGIIKTSEVARNEDGLYRPNIEYTYSVDNHTHSSSKIYFGDGAWIFISKPSKVIVNRYPVGKQVTEKWPHSFEQLTVVS